MTKKDTIISMYKIKISCNWTNSEDITRRLLTQFKTLDIDINDFEFVHDDNHDLHVVFGYINENVVKGKPIFIFPQEPSWSGGHQKCFNNLENIKVFGFERKNYTPQEIVIETVAHMFYGGRGTWEEGFDFWNYDNLTKNDFNKNKDFCSFVSNRGINDVSHPYGCLYGDRVELVKKIHNQLPFMDFYGWGQDKNLKPFARKKGETIKDYKFCLTIENSSEKYYLSEKFYDCIMTNTIPIYYGCSNIKDYWPENGYILLDNITDHNSIIKAIKELNENCNEIYESMLIELRKIKNRYFEEFNLIKKIKEEFNALQV